MAAGDMRKQGAVCRGWRRRSYCFATALGSGKAAREEADRRRLDIAFASRDLTSKSPARVRPEP
jgi:hypothetical protein